MFFLSCVRFEIGRFVAQFDVVVDEVEHNGLLAVGHHETHLAVALRDDRQRTQVVDVHIRRAEEVVVSRHEHVALVVLDAELAVLLVHLMILLILLADAVQIEHHLALVVHQFNEVGERVRVVSHGTCEHHLEVETRNHLAVQVDVAAIAFSFSGTVSVASCSSNLSMIALEPFIAFM